MTIGANNRMDYVGNGATAAYSYNFKIFAATDLRVTVQDTDGVETELTYTTHFTVSGVGAAAGGSISLVDGAFDWLDADGELEESYALTIRRVRPLTQSTDIRNQTQVFNDVLEDTYDHLMMVDQQQQDEIDRSVKFPETDGSASSELPSASVRALKVLIFDADGNVTVGEDNFAELAAAAAASAAAAAGSATSAAASAAAAAISEAQAAAIVLGYFLQSGTGAVERTFTSKNRDLVSVADFGTIGVSAAADGALFDLAVAAVSSAGCIINPRGSLVNLESVTVPNGVMVIDMAGGTIVSSSVAVGKSTQASGLHLLIRDVRSNTGTRAHMEPNGRPSGTRTKLDMMWDEYEVDGTNYRALVRFVSEDYSRGSGGFAFDGPKAVGHHFGVPPCWHLGFSDAAINTSVGFTLWYHDTSESTWQTPFIGAHEEGKTVANGDYFTANNKKYRSNTDGVFGATAPSHTAGTVTDTGISATFIRDYAASSGSFRAVAMVGDRDDRPTKGYLDVRMEFSKDTLTRNGAKHKFADSTGAHIWTLYNPVGTDDLYIENAAGTKRMRFDATGEFIQISGLSIAASGSSAADLDTTPSIKGVRLLTFGNSGPTTVTQFDDGIANQEFYVRSSNGQTTLQHSASLVLAGGVNKTLGTTDVLLFVMNTGGTIATQVT